MASGGEWRFGQTTREKGRIFQDIFQMGPGDTDLTPVLELLRGMGASISIRFSPYNTPYEVSVRGIVFVLFDDNWPGPYFSVAEADEAIFTALVGELMAGLKAIFLP